MAQGSRTQPLLRVTDRAVPGARAAHELSCECVLG